MSHTINVSMLAEMGDSAYFRLSSTIPDLPRSLRGRVMTAAKLANMAYYTVMVLKAADSDILAAQNERTMARSSAAKLHHMERANVLQAQAVRRQKASSARLEAILTAVAI